MVDPGTLSHIWYWIEVHTGTINETGPYYGFWSGFGSDIGEYSVAVSLIANFVHLVRSGNCHNKGCWRFGHHRTLAGYKLCKKCVTIPLGDLKVHKVHPSHQ